MAYFHPEPRHGLPGFKQVLRLCMMCCGRPPCEAVPERAGAHPTLQTSAQVASGDPPDLDQAVQTIMRQFDATNGGWSSAPGFLRRKPLMCCCAYQQYDDETQQAEFALQRMAWDL